MVSVLRRRQRSEQVEAALEPASPEVPAVDAIPITEDDPLHSYLVSVAAPVETAGLDMDSEALKALRQTGIVLIVPLVGQGELLGALYLGPRLSDQPYSSDDRKLLANLASQVAPAMRVAQLVREQQAEAKERERIQQELAVAALIQQTLLPKELPERTGWSVDAFYRPARSVGGDFYDFIELPGDRLGVAIGDFTDKGVPAALVMATCRSVLRAAATRNNTPGAVLADVNEILVDEIPPAMFVTCLYAIIETGAGRMTLANAGHNLPYIRTGGGVVELRATGMPLGLLPGMHYEERTFDFGDGDVMVLSSDGITEAHNPAGEMYGFARLFGRVGLVESDELVTSIVTDVEAHTGPEVQQEDDITLVVVRRTLSVMDPSEVPIDPVGGARRVLADFTVPSVEGNERIAIDGVEEAVAELGLEHRQLERLKTAVGETVMNAIEHGNQYRTDLEVSVSVEASPTTIAVRVSDSGDAIDLSGAPTPDIEAKLSGRQTPRGWGLFLIERMVDQFSSVSENGRHTIELIVNRQGAADAG